MTGSDRYQLGHRYFFSRGEKASDEYQQFWIRYRPERVIKKHFKHWNPISKIVLALVIGALLTTCFTLSPLMIAPLIAALLLTPSLLKLQFITFPTHISLSEEGIRLHWLRSFCNVSSGTIRWDNLTHVSINKQQFFGAAESMLEFNLSGAPFVLQERNYFPLISLSSGWLSGGRRKIEIALNGIASSDDRKRLQIALKKYLPSYRIETSVSDALGLSLRENTYTDLWLDSYSHEGGAKRLRENRLQPGDCVADGRYEIVYELGSGGQAIVYEALDKKKPVSEMKSGGSQDIVLKEFVLPAHAGNAVRKRVLDSINSEADLLKGLRHPNIVRLLDVFVEDERAYLVLERIKGLTLKKLVEEKGSMTEEQVVLLALQMCEILGYLHSHKVVHRDFTPDNLILGHGDILKLIDFNVAQQREGDGSKSVVGKHAYIPPEQFRGKATTQSDIYAAGATLSFLLTGQLPEPITTSHPRTLHPALSEDIDGVIARATAQDARERYPSCIEFRNDLQRIKQRYSDS